MIAIGHFSVVVQWLTALLGLRRRGLSRLVEQEGEEVGEGEVQLSSSEVLDGEVVTLVMLFTRCIVLGPGKASFQIINRNSQGSFRNWWNVVRLLEHASW